MNLNQLAAFDSTLQTAFRTLYRAYNTQMYIN